MRRSLIALAATALLTVGACSGNAASSAPTAAPTAAASQAPAGSTAAGGVAVSIKNFTFNPATINAKVGDTITWTNGDDAAHTVTFDDASITGSGSLNTGATFQLTTSKAGSFAFHCKIHPGMKGTLTVA